METQTNKESKSKKVIENNNIIIVHNIKATSNKELEHWPEKQRNTEIIIISI